METPTKSFIHTRYFYNFDENLPFDTALPEQIAKQQTRAVFVDRIYDGTPACKAGIKAGDVIFKINDKTVDGFESFRGIIDKSVPGDNLKLSIYRDGNVMEKTVIVGRETYSGKSVFYIGIMFSNKLILGYRNFSIFGLLGYEIENPRRPELHSLSSAILRSLIRNRPKIKRT
ncbi:MAG: PDZ domain-containing protein, partial [Victivallaceae bacterium]|nr:PDZ domain-containing protein [Victivallaceae bacterium]